MIAYEIFTEKPTLDVYRLSYNPREDYTLAGLWPAVIVTGASGKRYHGMRGFDEVAKGMAHTYIFVELKDHNLTDFSPQLYPELYIDQLEPYEYSESADAVNFVGENVRMRVRAGSYDWYDAKGRFQIHVEQLGHACTFWVPEQKGIPVPIHERSQIGKATGMINGDPVEGFSMFDAGFSHPGVLYFNLPLIRKIEKQWTMWLVEYTDGEIFGGFGWKGRRGTDFSAGHLVRNGVSTAHSDARTFTTYHERGAVWKSRIEVGGEVIEIEQDTCSDWPAHTFGRVVSTSRGKKIAKSWTFAEWIQDNVEELLERYLAGEIQVHQVTEARVENECIIFPDYILNPPK